MADENKPSLKDFLTRRKEGEFAVKPQALQVPKAPTPQSESPELPSRMTPPPERKQPGFIRKAAGAYAGEAFKGSGLIGQIATNRISGKGTASGMAAPPSYYGQANAVRLSKAAKAPDAKAIGRGNDPDDIEQGLLMLAHTIKDYSVYVQNEFKAVREDLEKVSTVASNAAKAVEQLKKDAQLARFKNSVARGSIRGKNGRFMSADQADADPDAVGWDGRIKPPGDSLFDAIWGYAKSAAGYAAGGAAGIYGAAKGLKAARGAAQIARGAGAVAAGAGVGSSVVAPKPNASVASRAARMALRSKGSMYGVFYELGNMMKNDKDHSMRSYLRGKLGIEDDDAPNSWEKDQPTQPQATPTKQGGDIKIDSPDSILIESKKNFTMTATQDMRLEAKNELSIKARVLTIDAEKIEFKGNAKFGSGAGTATGNPNLAPAGGQSMRGGENLTTEELAYQANVNKYGREKADELRKIEKGNSWSLGNVLGKVNNAMPWSSGSARNSSSGSSNASMYTGKGTQARPPDAQGKYRPVYNVGDDDISDDVVNTVAGEAYTNNQQSVDAVLNNMFNRIGTKTYGPSGNLREVARAKGQYAGYRQASPKEAEMIRARIRAIASGEVEDITGGANEFRASWYEGPWYQKNKNSPVIGGNRFGYNSDVKPGPYAPYAKPGEPSAPGKAPASTMYNGDSSIVNLGKGLQGMGLRVSENSAFGGVNPVHRGKGHYADRALDVNVGRGVEEASHAQWSPIFDKLSAFAQGHGFKSVWKSAGHFNHWHVEAPEGMKPKAIDMAEFYKTLTPEERAFIEKDRGVKLDLERKADVANADAVAANPTGTTATGPLSADAQRYRPRNIEGTIDMPAVGNYKATTYRAGSGGFSDGTTTDTAIPYGVYPIGGPQPSGPVVSNFAGGQHEIFPVGFGSGNRVIPDPKLGRNRTDIQIHSDNDASKLLSLGCLAIPKADYPKFLAHMKAKIAAEGPQVLRISPSAPGAAHKFEILSAKAAAGSTAPKVTASEAAEDFRKTGDIGKPESLSDKLDERNWAAKDAAWFAKSGAQKIEDTKQTKHAEPVDHHPGDGHDHDDDDKSMSDMLGAKDLDADLNKMPAVQATDGIKSITVKETGAGMSDQLGAKELDAATNSDAEMIRGIPTPPNLHTNEDPDAGQRLTDSIKEDSTTKDAGGSTVADQSKPSESARTGRSSGTDIQAPSTFTGIGGSSTRIRRVR